MLEELDRSLCFMMTVTPPSPPVKILQRLSPTPYFSTSGTETYTIRRVFSWSTSWCFQILAILSRNKGGSQWNLDGTGSDRSFSALFSSSDELCSPSLQPSSSFFEPSSFVLEPSSSLLELYSSCVELSSSFAELCSSPIVVLINTLSSACSQKRRRPELHQLWRTPCSALHLTTSLHALVQPRCFVVSTTCDCVVFVLSFVLVSRDL